MTSGQTQRIRVLMVGPAAPAVGGMVSVMETLAASPLGHEAHLTLMSTHLPWGRRWGLFGAACRHVVLLAHLLWRVLRHRVDLVHIHTCSFFTFYRNMLDLALAHLLRGKVIIHVHGRYFHKFHANSGRLGRAAIRAGLQRADAVIVLSDWWRDWMGRVAPRAKVRVIHNGVPLPRGRSRTDASPSAPCHFLYLALMDESKGLFDLLKAAAGLRAEGLPFQLTLAGPWASDQARERFENETQHHGIADAVRYAGVVNQESREALLAGADVLVLPSHSEAMPMSMLEAMACSLPVIGTRVGAVGETARHRIEGLIIQPSDVDALARCMRELAEDPALRHSLGARARLRIERSYSDAVQAEAVLDLYRTLCPPRTARVLLAGR